MNSQIRVLAGALCLVLSAGLLAFGLQPYGVYLLSLWAVYTISAIGLNLTLGYAGQVSLAQASFVGIGAYTTALLMPHGVPFGFTLLIGAALCFGLGMLLGFPAIRVQGHYLAFVTLALATITFLVFRNKSWLTGGIDGISHIRRPALFTGDLGYLGSAFTLALVTFGTWWLLRSPWAAPTWRCAKNPCARRPGGGRTSLHAAGVRDRRGAGRGIGIALCALGAIYRTLSLRPRPVVQPAAHGGGGRVGIVSRPLSRPFVAVLLPEWLRFLEGYYLVISGVLVRLSSGRVPRGAGRAGRTVAPLAAPGTAPTEPTA